MTVLQALLELQEVDGRIREFEAELKDLPNRKAVESASLTGLATELSNAKAALHAVEEKAKGFEEEASGVRDEIQRLKVAQTSLKSNKEYQQYSVQIDLKEHSLEAAENNQVAALDEAPAARKRIDDAQAAYDAKKETVDAFCREMDERIAALEDELAAAKKEREEKARAVNDPKFTLYYERLKTKRWPVVSQLTRDGVCDGCHLVQPPSVAQLVDANAKRGDEGSPQAIIACTMCGRLLYR